MSLRPKPPVEGPEVFRPAKDDKRPFAEAKPIPGYPGYHVSPIGEVWSTRKRFSLAGHPKGASRSICDAEPHRLKAHPDPDGYSRVTLFGHLNRAVHLLVLETFVGPRPPGCVARHLDGNPGNPAVDNLCWGTYEENEADKRRHGTLRAGERHRWTRLSDETVREIRAAATTATHKEIARRFGVHKSYVSHLLRGKIRRSCAA